MGDKNGEFYSGGAIGKRPWLYYGIRAYNRHIGIPRYQTNDGNHVFPYTFPFNMASRGDDSGFPYTFIFNFART